MAMKKKIDFYWQRKPIGQSRKYGFETHTEQSPLYVNIAYEKPTALVHVHRASSEVSAEITQHS